MLIPLDRKIQFFGDDLIDHHPRIIPYFPKTKKPCRARKMDSAGRYGFMQISAHPAYTGSLLQRNRPDLPLMSSGITRGVLPAVMILVSRTQYPFWFFFWSKKPPGFSTERLSALWPYALKCRKLSVFILQILISDICNVHQS